jgi:hypothetical protein
MPIPSFIISVNLFVCERTLVEADGVLSAIRLIDIFFVPRERPVGVSEEVLPLVQAYGCALLKTKPGYVGQHALEMKTLNTVGEMTSTGDPTIAKIFSKPGMEDVPGGISIAIQLNIAVKRFGTCYLCLFLDGEEIARSPFTLLPHPSTAKSD